MIRLLLLSYFFLLSTCFGFSTELAAPPSSALESNFLTLGEVTGGNSTENLHELSDAPETPEESSPENPCLRATLEMIRHFFPELPPAAPEEVRILYEGLVRFFDEAEIETIRQGIAHRHIARMRHDDMDPDKWHRLLIGVYSLDLGTFDLSHLAEAIQPYTEWDLATVKKHWPGFQTWRSTMANGKAKATAKPRKKKKYPSSFPHVIVGG